LLAYTLGTAFEKLSASSSGDSTSYRKHRWRRILEAATAAHAVASAAEEVPQENLVPGHA
jgi:hypothetical protein